MINYRIKVIRIRQTKIMSFLDTGLSTVRTLKTKNFTKPQRSQNHTSAFSDRLVVNVPDFLNAAQNVKF